MVSDVGMPFSGGVFRGLAMNVGLLWCSRPHGVDIIMGLVNLAWGLGRGGALVGVGLVSCVQS